MPLFTKKTVDSIIKSFSSMQADLATLVTEKTAENEMKLEAAALLQSEVNANVTEMTRANAIISKINEMIGG